MPIPCTMPPLIWLSTASRFSGKPAVLHVKSCGYLNMTGFRIHFNFGKACPVRPVVERPRLTLAADGDSGRGQSGASLLPGQRFAVGGRFVDRQRPYRPGLARTGATALAISALALIAATLTAGDSDAGRGRTAGILALPSRVSPIFSCTSPISSPSSSATMATMYVRVPVPRSCVPQDTMTDPSRPTADIDDAFRLLPPPPQMPHPQPNPPLQRCPAIAPGVRLRRSQPISFAPTLKLADMLIIRRRRFSIRNSTGSIPIL